MRIIGLVTVRNIRLARARVVAISDTAVFTKNDSQDFHEHFFSKEDRSSISSSQRRSQCTPGYTKLS